MGKFRELLDRMTGKGGNAEADVQADPARADSRDPDGSYVGRTAADEDFSGETGAERRNPPG
jgi:hypothetical protein